MNPCPQCSGTGLVPVPWTGWDKGREVTLYDRHRKACPMCEGKREIE